MIRACGARMRAISVFFALLACASCVSSGSSDRGPGGAGSTVADAGSRARADAGADGPSNADTCTIGDTMTAPRLASPPAAEGANTTLRLAWDPGTGPAADLPASYFEKVKLEEDSIAVAAAPAGAREMIVTLAGAPATHAGKTETFALLFPDRRDFVACGHGGMDDVYRLVVTVTFSSDATSATATFEQKVDLGDF